MSRNSRWLVALSTGFLLFAANHFAMGQEDALRRNNARVFSVSFYRVSNAAAVDDSVRRLRSDLLDTLARQAGNDAYSNNLTPAEEQKLQLADRRDIKAFFEWADARRSEFESVDWQTFAGQRHLMNVVGEKKQRIERLFGDDSFYAKVLNKLNAETRVAGDPRDAEATGR